MFAGENPESKPDRIQTERTFFMILLLLVFLHLIDKINSFPVMDRWLLTIYPPYRLSGVSANDNPHNLDI